MQISQAGLAFIESNEGFSAQVYEDNGRFAIGFGHDLLPGEAFVEGITRAGAESLLLSDIEPIDVALAGLVPPTCTQNQWDALCDFAYNLGVGSLKTMLAHGWEQVPLQIPRWNMENGAPSVGLSRRRAAEVKMFVG
jgi:lysozyme